MNRTLQFSADVDALRFHDPVAFSYNPLDYAAAPHFAYLRRYAASLKDFLFVGMNPGPFGMAQTGVPFGEVNAVRDFLGVFGLVKAPLQLHPKRPITGFDCTRSEVSGRRLWGFIREQYGTAAHFAKSGFVYNYCPLIFFSEDGKNLTPDKLHAKDRVELFNLCDAYLGDTVRILKPKFVIGVGKFAFDRAQIACKSLPTHVVQIIHPSPASPAANRGWSKIVLNQLIDHGVLANQN